MAFSSVLHTDQLTNMGSLRLLSLPGGFFYGLLVLVILLFPAAPPVYQASGYHHSNQYPGIRIKECLHKTVEEEVEIRHADKYGSKSQKKPQSLFSVTTHIHSG